ncbi:tRNA (adenosine(37)-N6)-threonylcarbamoyltransferase complex transferase subunit TsaD [Candidatus Nomurabacteria bacterium]|nr:tRNA (adenosine(37)-N6)-threonylcarbamoyltransferase complex transferase subunit TsaD [Candidatus Nomurabacteria bacterium]
MIILGIETSCDDTALSVVEFTEQNGQISCKILANAVSSQTELGIQYGGVFPAMAKQEHIKNLPIVYDYIVKETNNIKIDTIALTVGPGLEPCLWTGITFAKELAEKLGVPIIPVNHMEGHLLSSLLPEFAIGKEIILRDFPTNAISLLVSGGHTQIIKINNLGDYEIIGTTLDDAVGEAFDKVARMMDLPYPGGPAISKLAKISRTQSLEPRTQNLKPVIFPRPMLHSKDYNFSFSGLKTAVLYHIRDNPIKSDEDKIAIAREFEDASIEVIIKKIVNAMQEFGSTHLLLGGGVAANKYLQSELARVGQTEGYEIYYPVREITGDNALMIAIAGYFHKDIINTKTELKANGSLRL